MLKSAPELVRVIGVASSLGTSSAALPAVRDQEIDFFTRLRRPVALRAGIGSVSFDSNL
ncbi:MAG: hypothetical protein ACT4P5_02135 [Armatimonadota bacterium]